MSIFRNSEMVTAAPLAHYAIEHDVAVVTLDSPPVNAMSQAVRARMFDLLQAAFADPKVRAVVVMGAGRGFSGGADITEFTQPPRFPTLQDLIEALDAAPKPVVAALHGMALGGGLELALACHHRVAAPGARLGLPEVKLGLLPGGGGTQRLPRVVGVAVALEMIVSGDPVDATMALSTGLIERVIEGDLREGATAFAQALPASQPRRTRDREDRLDAARANSAMFERFVAAHPRRFKNVVAPASCVAAVKAAVELPFDAGIVRERELFIALLQGPQSAAQRYAFFAERRAGKVDDLPDDLATQPIHSVGIVGAGTMGGGIAMSFVDAGLPVTLIDTQPEALERGLATIRRNYEASARRGRIAAEDVPGRMDRLTGAASLEALADCDLIIEAVFEEIDVKREVFAKLDAIAKPGAILASNTSYLDIDAIAAATSRPQSVLGLHFFSPANIMRLLEVVRGAKTDPAVIATAMRLARGLGKVGVCVRVCQGFVGNRMLAARQEQANALILEGAAPWEVDRVLTDFGMPMGPFAMADLAGLDLGWTRAHSTGATVRELLCEQGRFGQKTGGGFYDYDSARKATPSPIAEAAVLEISAREGRARRTIGDQEILERCLYPMINEGAKILSEGVAARASDIDVVWVAGYGWPVWRGGPMYYADTLGVATVLERLREFYAHDANPAYAPAPLLERLAEQGGRFRDL